MDDDRYKKTDKGIKFNLKWTERADSLKVSYK
jgi:hypothetical protein